eukprot:3143712-Amphidinium_carterae.1
MLRFPGFNGFVACNGFLVSFRLVFTVCARLGCCRMVHFLAVVMLACAAPAVHASDLTSVVNDETDFVLEEPKRELTESSEKCSCPDTSQVSRVAIKIVTFMAT